MSNESFMSLVVCESLQKMVLETSLVVQRLRLCAPSAGDPGSIPGQGTRSRMPQLKIMHAATKHPACRNERSHMPQLKIPHSASEDPAHSNKDNTCRN